MQRLRRCRGGDRTQRDHVNVLSAGQAVNDLIMMFTGLFAESVQLPHQFTFVRERLVNSVEPLVDEQCLDCGTQPRSRRAMGDRMRLPCRMPPKSTTEPSLTSIWKPLFHGQLDSHQTIR